MKRSIVIGAMITGILSAGVTTSQFTVTNVHAEENAIESSINLAQYYTTNPGQVAILTNTHIYSNINLTDGMVKAVTKGTLITVRGIKYTSGGTPRLVVDGGYLTANKINVVKPISAISNYYTTNPGQVAILNATHIYSNINLTDGMVRALPKGSLISVKGIEYTKGGTPRLVVNDGYITANKNNVTKPRATISNYYTTNPGQVTILNATHIYSNINLTGSVVRALPKGSVISTKGIEYTKGGTPRLVVNGGYITDSKDNVREISSITAKASNIVALAKTKLGDRYTTAQSGRLGPNSFDCSGFVYYLYKTAAGITFAGTTTTAEEGLGKEVSLSSIRPGDLLFYGTRGNTYHVGVYEGNGIMIHAATESEGVKETALKYYEPSFARRILN